MNSQQSFLTLSSQRDREGNPILLLHSDTMPSFKSPTAETEIQRQISFITSQLPPSSPITLVYCHGYLARQSNPLLSAVRSFRYVWDTHVPLNLRTRLTSIIALHVSFMTRSHIYASSFRLQAQEWSKLVYCDLISDLESRLGVESTVLGLRDIDFDYDEEMRHWVGRQNELNPNQAANQTPLDPSKPIINTEDISIKWNDDNASENHSVQPSFAEP